MVFLSVLFQLCIFVVQVSASMEIEVLFVTSSIRIVWIGISFMTLFT